MCVCVNVGTIKDIAEREREREREREKEREKEREGETCLDDGSDFVSLRR
jgi:hypothetical protein